MRERLELGELSRFTQDMLDEYALIRVGCTDIREAAVRMNVEFKTLDKVLYRARLRGDVRGRPPQAQYERALLRGVPFREPWHA